MNRFPPNPNHGDIFELNRGLLYQYDAGVKSWIRVVSSNVVLPQATQKVAGIMTAVDLRKLNRLVLPPPTSTIVGNDCLGPFTAGNIRLINGDNFVNVDGELNLKNVDEFGGKISEAFPFQIHQHTYGYDFNLDIPRLVQELVRRGQLNVVGQTGDEGDKGETGDPGIDGIFSGPQGQKGEQGLAPPCELELQAEQVPTELQPGLDKAFTKVNVIDNPNDPTNPLEYFLEIERKVVGKEDASTDKFNVRQQDSFWVLAVASIVGNPQPVYYFDIEPLIEAVRSKFNAEVDLLKAGYEDIVKFWIQTMSDLFDEQKDALCCALEFCLSKTKSDHLRRHMEDVAASALPDARIDIVGRGECAELSSTRLLGDLPDGKDLCQGGPSFPSASSRSASVPSPASAVASVSTKDDNVVTVDPAINTGSALNGEVLELSAGDYVAIIEEATSAINAKHRANVRIQYISNGKKKTSDFLDKGEYDSLVDGKHAYEGLTLPFRHDGGEIRVFFPILPQKRASGSVVIRIQQSTSAILPEVVKPVQQTAVTPAPLPRRKSERITAVSSNTRSCFLDVSRLRWYERGWKTGNCCGLVLNLGGQDYIIVKKSLGDDTGCGGGESEETPCIGKFKNSLGHPAFAWPTLDGKNFIPIPDDVDQISFKYDQSLNDLASAKIQNEEYDNPMGNPNGVRHLSFQLMTILFPIA